MSRLVKLKKSHVANAILKKVKIVFFNTKYDATYVINNIAAMMLWLIALATSKPA